MANNIALRKTYSTLLDEVYKIASVTAVLDGNSYYFIRLDGDPVFYSISASAAPIVVTLDPGDAVSIEHAPAAEGEENAILGGYTIAVTQKGNP